MYLLQKMNPEEQVEDIEKIIKNLESGSYRKE